MSSDSDSLMTFLQAALGRDPSDEEIRIVLETEELLTKEMAVYSNIFKDSLYIVEHNGVEMGIKSSFLIEYVRIVKPSFFSSKNAATLRKAFPEISQKANALVDAAYNEYRELNAEAQTRAIQKMLLELGIVPASTNSMLTAIPTEKKDLN